MKKRLGVLGGCLLDTQCLHTSIWNFYFNKNKMFLEMYMTVLVAGGPYTILLRRGGCPLSVVSPSASSAANSSSGANRSVVE